ncbi:MAG: hypothetical protein ACFFBH_14310 [Promethearchaeota archaeon]
MYSYEFPPGSKLLLGKRNSLKSIFVLLSRVSKKPLNTTRTHFIIAPQYKLLNGKNTYYLVKCSRVLIYPGAFMIIDAYYNLQERI